MFQPQEPFCLFSFGEIHEQWEPIPSIRRGPGWGGVRSRLCEECWDGLVMSAGLREGSDRPLGSLVVWNGRSK